MALDLVLKNARVLDGSGNPWFRADVGVQGDRIAAVGRLGVAEAGRVIDCRGQILAPGFVDMHVHSDVMLLAEPRHEAKIYQGVTLEVLGQDGLSYAPASPATLAMLRQHLCGLNGDPDVGWDWSTVAQFLARFDHQVAVNTTFLIPHSAVRAEVLGMEDRLATPAEMERMKALVRQGMEDGAVGLSTGLTYSPNCWSNTDELVELCSVVAAFGGIYVTHMRYTLGWKAAIRESLEISERSGAPVQISHLRGSGAGEPPGAAGTLAMLDEARARGIDVTFDSYAYVAGSSMLQARLPYWALVGGPEKVLERCADPTARQRIREEYQREATNWGEVRIGYVKSEANRWMEGKDVATLMEETGKDAADFVCDLLLAEGLAVSFVAFGPHEVDIPPILAHPLATSGSDGLCIGSKRNPRTYGSFARVLGRYVREQKVMPLQDAVRKMTAACAQRLGIRDRGLVREGMFADLVVFDDQAIIDRSTFEEPLRRAAGVSYVLVNGQVVLDGGQHTGATPGRALKPLLAGGRTG